MKNTGGLIALLLVVAILCTPFDGPAQNRLTESPLLSGDSAAQSDTAPQDGGETDTVKIIAAVVIVIIVICIICYIADTGNQPHERR
jgi:hypothetical protein